MDETGEGGQKAQNSCYKVSLGDVRYNMVIIVNIVLCISTLLREDLKFQEKNFNTAW